MILAIQITIMFYLNKKITKAASDYPLLDCTDVSRLYGDNLQKFAVI